MFHLTELETPKIMNVVVILAKNSQIARRRNLDSVLNTA